MEISFRHGLLQARPTHELQPSTSRKQQNQVIVMVQRIFLHNYFSKLFSLYIQHFASFAHKCRLKFQNHIVELNQIRLKCFLVQKKPNRTAAKGISTMLCNIVCQQDGILTNTTTPADYSSFWFSNISLLIVITMSRNSKYMCSNKASKCKKKS